MSSISDSTSHSNIEDESNSVDENSFQESVSHSESSHGGRVVRRGGTVRGRSITGRLSKFEDTTTKSSQKLPVIGAPIASLLSFDGQTRTLPLILKNCLDFMRDDESILASPFLFRNTAKDTYFTELNAAYISPNINVNFTKFKHQIVDMFLLHWLNELPESLISQNFEQFVKLYKASSRTDSGSKVARQVSKLPQMQRNIVHYLLTFLNDLTRYSSKSGLTIETVASIFGPLLRPNRAYFHDITQIFTPDSNVIGEKISSDVDQVAASVKITLSLLKHIDHIFGSTEVEDREEIPEEQVAEDLVKVKRKTLMLRAISTSEIDKRGKHTRIASTGSSATISSNSRTQNLKISTEDAPLRISQIQPSSSDPKIVTSSADSPHSPHSPHSPSIEIPNTTQIQTVKSEPTIVITTEETKDVITLDTVDTVDTVATVDTVDKKEEIDLTEIETTTQANLDLQSQDESPQNVNTVEESEKVKIEEIEEISEKVTEATESTLEHVQIQTEDIPSTASPSVSEDTSTSNSNSRTSPDSPRANIENIEKANTQPESTLNPTTTESPSVYISSRHTVALEDLQEVDGENADETPRDDTTQLKDSPKKDKPKAKTPKTSTEPIIPEASETSRKKIDSEKRSNSYSGSPHTKRAKPSPTVTSPQISTSPSPPPVSPQNISVSSPSSLDQSEKQEKKSGFVSAFKKLVGGAGKDQRSKSPSKDRSASGGNSTSIKPSGISPPNFSPSNSVPSSPSTSTIFGKSLDTLLNAPRDESVESALNYQQRCIIPYVISDCISFLSQKERTREFGIFRESGSFKDKVRLMNEYNTPTRSLKFDNTDDVFTIATLIKEWLRALPDSLLTSELYGAFKQAIDTAVEDDEVIELPGFSVTESAKTHTTAESNEQEPDEKSAKRSRKAARKFQQSIPRHFSITQLIDTVSSLPMERRSILQYLINFLKSEVVTYSEINKMTSSNVAIVFGPCLHRTQSPTNEELMDPVHTKIVEAMIDYYDLIFAQWKVMTIVNEPTPVIPSTVALEQSLDSEPSDKKKKRKSASLSVEEDTGGRRRSSTTVGDGPPLPLQWDDSKRYKTKQRHGSSKRLKVVSVPENGEVQDHRSQSPALSPSPAPAPAPALPVLNSDSTTPLPVSKPTSLAPLDPNPTPEALDKWLQEHSLSSLLPQLLPVIGILSTFSKEDFCLQFGLSGIALYKAMHPNETQNSMTAQLDQLSNRIDNMQSQLSKIESLITKLVPPESSHKE